MFVPKTCGLGHLATTLLVGVKGSVKFFPKSSRRICIKKMLHLAFTSSEDLKIFAFRNVILLSSVHLLGLSFFIRNSNVRSKVGGKVLIRM